MFFRCKFSVFLLKWHLCYGYHRVRDGGMGNAKIFIENIAPETDIAVLTGEAAAHARVLRLKSGEQVVLCDGQGTDYQAEISHIDDKSVTLKITVPRSLPKVSLRWTGHGVYGHLPRAINWSM